MPSTYLTLPSLTLSETWQPTPQNGQTDLTSLSKSVLSPTCAASSTVAGISAPVGQACTHSPQATQVRLAHRVGDIEDRIGVMAAPGHADHVVDLHLAAGAHAKSALDAGIEVDAHRDMAVVEKRDAFALQLREAAFG